MIRRGEVRAIPEDVVILQVDAGANLPSLVNAEGILVLAVPGAIVKRPVLLVLENCERLQGLPRDEFGRQWRELTRCLAFSTFFFVTTGRSENPLLREAEPSPVRPLTLSLKGLREADARQAILASSVFAGVTWESGLPERITCDLAEASPFDPSPEGAPARVDPSLLALVAAELVNGQTWQLTHKRYDEGGCLGERLPRIASDALGKAGEPGRVRSLLIQLVTPDGSRRRLTVARAIKILGGEDGEALLEKLAELRLLRIGSHVELRHSLLATRWTTLRQWLTAEEQTVTPDDALLAARGVWEATGHAVSAIPRGRTRAFMSRAADIDPESRVFLRRAWQGEIFRSLAVLITAGALLWGGVAIRDWSLERKRLEIVRKEAEKLASRSVREEVDPVKALALAIAAGEKSDTPSTHTALNRAIHLSRLRAVLKHDDPVVRVSLARDGTSLLSVTLPGAPTVWDPRTGTRHSYAMASNDHGYEFLLSRDATTIAKPSRGEWTIWNLKDHALREINTQRNALLFLRRNPAGNIGALSSDGDHLAIFSPKTSFGPDTLWLWNAIADTIEIVGADLRLTRLAFTPNDDVLVGTSDLGMLNVWARLHNPTYVPIRDFVRVNRRGITSLAISESGSRIITTANVAKGQSQVAIWLLSPSNPDMLASARWFVTFPHSVQVPVAAFGNHDASFMAVGDDGIHVWPVSAAPSGLLITPAFGPVAASAFDPHSPRLVAAGYDGRILLWKANDLGTKFSSIMLLGHTARVNTVFFSDDGSQIVSASDDGTVRLWWASDVSSIPPRFADLLQLARDRLPITLTRQEQASLIAETPSGAGGSAF
jgi:WD40 repeat protein